MATQPRTAVAPGHRLYQDDEPSFEWVQGETSNTLLLHLPGYKREHLKLHIDSRGQLKTSGERPIGSDRWRRFSREFKLPHPCSVNDIRAKFENEILYVDLPKRIARADAQGQRPAAETKPGHYTDVKNQNAKTGGGSGDTEARARAREDAKKDMERMEEQGIRDRRVADQTRQGDDRNKMANQATPGGYGECSATYRASARHDMSSILMELSKYKSLLIDVVVFLMMLLGLGVYMKMNKTQTESV